jgi:hypothetical protein
MYMMGDGRAVAGPQHGGGGGGLNVFHLDADEYLTGISGRAGSFIDSIRFETNKRTSPIFGGSGGSRDFRIEVPADTQVTGFVGRAGLYLDAIGLAFLPERRVLNSSYGRTEQSSQTSLAGGTGGEEFLDGNIPPGARIIEVRVAAAEFVDSVQMIYGYRDRDGDGRPFEAARHGGEGGREMSFRLEPGEYIIGLSGRCGKYLDSLRIHTNRRTSQLFGGSGGEREFRIDVPYEKQVTGFVGRSGKYLDAIGLTYSEIPHEPRGYRARGDYR